MEDMHFSSLNPSVEKIMLPDKDDIPSVPLTSERRKRGQTFDDAFKVVKGHLPGMRPAVQKVEIIDQKQELIQNMEDILLRD